MVWLLWVLVPAFAIALVLHQHGFEGSVFEFGKQTEMEGVISIGPVPTLRVAVHEKPLVEKHVLLVGFGKFGATATLEQMAREKGLKDQTQVRVRGTLIYHNGKTLLELTDGVDALLSVGATKASEPQRFPYGEQSLAGEILDAKCHFGVMKPGEGKTHRSCAARCISGGVPVVLKTYNPEQYFILLGPDGQAINQGVIPYLAQPVHLCGDVQKLDDWLYCYVDLEQGIRPLSPNDPDGMIMCR